MSCRCLIMAQSAGHTWICQGPATRLCMGNSNLLPIICPPLRHHWCFSQVRGFLLLTRLPSLLQAKHKAWSVLRHTSLCGLVCFDFEKNEFWICPACIACNEHGKSAVVVDHKGTALKYECLLPTVHLRWQGHPCRPARHCHPASTPSQGARTPS